MGASMSLELFHASILDAVLLAEELDLLLEPVPFGSPTEFTVHALRSPALSQRQGGSGERDNLDYRGADAAWPASGQGKRTKLRGTGHDEPPEGIQG